MFTGIITNLGKLEAVKKNRYVFSSDKLFFAKLGRGGSVSINGVCLTVITEPRKNRFLVEVMPETLKKTALEELRPGHYVNLELPVSLESLFSGHIVQGHVDGTGIMSSIAENPDNSWLLKIKVAKDVSKFLVEKGSIAVNGISLTIIETGKDYFTVGIIPYTWKNTMLKYGKIGGRLNLEIDVIAKYVEKFTHRHS